MARRTGKGALAKRRKRRLSEKRARKAAAKLKYEQWMREGRNTKSKRAKLRAKLTRKKKLRTKRHASGPCGNIGCKRCTSLQ
jgi:ribosomal protein S4